MPAPLIPREAVLDRIIEAFRTRGYDGATLSRLSEATGLVKASLYHYFPAGKEDMARAALDALTQKLVDEVLQPMDAEPDPLEKLRVMVEGLKRFYEGGKAACMLEVFSLGTARELFGEQIRNAFIRLRDTLAQTLARNGQDLATALARAELAVAAVQGALVMSRGLGEPDTFENVLGSLPGLLLP